MAEVPPLQPAVHRVDAPCAASARPTVEVVLCTYNGERYVGEQLDSILRQSRPVDLVSVCDDGSTDGTLLEIEACVARFGATAPRVGVHRNQRTLGYAKNFGGGIARATCDVLLLCDQDDIWELEKVRKLLDAMAQKRAAIAFSDGELVDSDGASLAAPTVLQGYGLAPAEARRFSRDARRLLLRRNFINGAAMAVRRIDAQRALPIPDEFPHDYWLALWIATTGGAIVCVAESLYRYRQHGNNIIGAGRIRFHHQLASVWRDPASPRRLDVARTAALLRRLPDDPAARHLVKLKQLWLVEVTQADGVRRRFHNIVRSWWRGDYARFAPPYALARDLVMAVRRMAVQADGGPP